MKKILSIAFVMAIWSSSFAQTYQATIKDAGDKRTLQIYIKPSAAQADVSISNWQFTLGVPKKTGGVDVVKPALQIASNPFSTGVTYDVKQNETADFFYYTLDGSGVASNPPKFSFDGETKVLDIVFENGILPAQIATIRLAQLPSETFPGVYYTNFYLEFGGNDFTNTTAQFYGQTATNDGNGYSGNSFVTLSDIALPVKFLSFYALKSGSDAKLTWTVENDADNKYFDIERSTDGRTYAPFTRVNALNNGKSVNTYDIADNGSLSSSLVYYRIKQVDKNGNTTYSLIRNLKLDKSAAISLYPNPARTTTKLVFDAAAAGKASVTIRDVAGKQVQQINIQLVKGINQQTLNVHTLPAGEYNVTINGTNLKETIKLSRVN